MKLTINTNAFTITHQGKVILEHSETKPFLYVGVGKENIKQHLGDFRIEDRIIEKIPMKYLTVSGDSFEFTYGDYKLSLRMSIENNRLEVKEFRKSDGVNRIYFMLNSDENERFFGCGEQFSYFNLKGRNYPIWTSEPGVGRDPDSIITFKANQIGLGGGDYHRTNYPQPTFISDRKYLFHMNTAIYCDFDFSEDDHSEISVWGTPDSFFIEFAESFEELMGAVTSEFGTQPMLPDWMMDGVTLGMQGGTEAVYRKIRTAKEYGIKVNAVWVQDWVGKKVTSFGRRLFWKWALNEEAYPNFTTLMEDLKKDDIKFLAYINPYLLEGTDMFNYAKEHEYFVKKESGEAYVADFGEFNCGTIDFTNPDANSWYKKIIKENMIDLGISGWMADFGEYVPVDAVFHNGKTGYEMHNAFPALWAKCNYEAIEESGKLGEIVFFMRSGGIGNAKHCTLMWAGDQSVDFSIHDGIASTIPAALSLSLMGNGLTHFDIGGYTSMFGNKRTEEVLLRSLEYSVFTPYMRTHEGNRPTDNFQYDESETSLKQFARFSNLRSELIPYIRSVVEENATTGMGAIRPLFMHYDEKECLDITYEYLFGRDMLVAPVYEEGVTEWEVYLPEDNWVHLLTKEEFQGGNHKISAELGNIPVFYRKESEYKTLFDSIK